MQTHARVVVIGGGIMGCSLIYHLTAYGWDDVVLVEKNELTAGSTWHAAGLCTHYAHDITMMNLRAHSVKLYSGLLERETGQPVGFHATGALRVTTRPDRMDEFRHVQGLGRFADHDFNILSPQELKQLYPLVRTEGLLGAIHEPCDGYVDPSQATHALARGARNRGAVIYRNNPLKAITRVRGEWLLQTENGDIRAEHIVNAAGTWCREVGSMMALDLPVVPMLHQYIVMDRIEEFAGIGHELPFIRDPDESWYLRQERDGVILGAYEKNGRAWAVDGVDADFGMQLLPPELGRIEDMAANCIARVPAAGQGGIKNVVNGPITFTPDANPLIGPAFDLPNAWLLTGSSMGVMEGGGAGQFLARWMIDGEPPADALAVDARRFGGYADRDYRLNKARECFAAQFGIHYPYEERPAGREKRLTPIYHRLQQAGAVFGSVYGWERPNWYAAKGQQRHSELGFQRCNWFAAVAEECRRASEDVVVGDLSAFSKFVVKGSQADAFMRTLGSRPPPAITGQIALVLVLTGTGGVAAEFIVTRVSDNHYYLVGAAAAERINQDLLKHRAAPFNDLQIQNVTAQTAVLGVMGPKAEPLLSALSEDDTCFTQSSFPWLSARQMVIAGVETTAMRVSYIGESGWELHHAMQDQPKLFDQLMRVGQPHDVGLYGAFAMNAMRLEKGYRAWGSEYTTERTPLEAGVGMLVDVDSRADSRDFIGKQAMLERQAGNHHWSMHLLKLEDTGEDPFYAHTVLQNRKPIGIVTSGGYGHRVKKPLALAYFRTLPDRSGHNPLYVEILGKMVEASILNQIPYDPHNRKLRA